VIDLDKLHRTWGVEFNRTDDHDGLTALARLARAHRDHGELTAEEFAIVCGLGAKRRAELNGEPK
jgi:hypothetical protein